MSQTFAFDGILGGLNLFKRRDNRFVLDLGERPPYPIINSGATFVDVVDNLNAADAGLVGLSALAGKIFQSSMGLVKDLIRVNMSSFKQIRRFSVKIFCTLWDDILLLKNRKI